MNIVMQAVIGSVTFLTLLAAAVFVTRIIDIFVKTIPHPGFPITFPLLVLVGVIGALVLQKLGKNGTIVIIDGLLLGAAYCVAMLVLPSLFARYPDLLEHLSLPIVAVATYSAIYSARFCRK